MSEKAKPRLPIAWILVGVLLGIPIVLCGGVGVWFVGRNSVAQAKLDKEIETLVSKGLPVDDRSMTEYHAKLTDDLYTAKWLEILRVTEGEEFRNQAKNLPVIGNAQELPKGDEAWQEQATVEAFLKEHADTIAVIHEVAASDAPVRFPIDFRSFDTLLENTQAMRGISRLMMLEHEVALRQGDADREYAALQALLGASIAIRGEPILVSHLVHIALHGIAVGRIQESVARGQLTEQQWTNILNRLAIFEDFKSPTEQSIAGERAMAMPVFQNPGKLQESGPTGVLGARPIDALAYLRLMKRYEDAVTGDLNHLIKEAEAADEAFQTELGDANFLKKFDTIMTGLLAPALGSYSTAVVRSVISNRLARTGIAIRIFQLRNQSLPNDISELESLPFDLAANAALDGKPFGYKQTRDGAILWAYDLQGRVSVDAGESVPAEPPSTLSPDGTTNANEMWVWEFKSR